MIKIYSKEENAEGVEIGMARKVRFKWDGDGLPIAGGGIYELREEHLPKGLQVYDWKTPVSPFSLPPTGARADRQQYDNAMMIIAHLTHVLGGGVTIQPHEMVDASRLELIAHQQLDPSLFIIKTKEK